MILILRTRRFSTAINPDYINHRAEREKPRSHKIDLSPKSDNNRGRKHAQQMVSKAKVLAPKSAFFCIFLCSVDKQGMARWGTTKSVRSEREQVGSVCLIAER